MVKFLDLNKQYQSIKSEIDEAIASIIAKSAFIGGEAVKNFEAEFAAFQQAKHCIGVGNGTDALEIALEALNLPAGSEVIVPANSFIASSEAVTRAGLKVVFCDVDVGSMIMTPETIEKAITDNTSALMVVHLYGHPCDMDGIIALAEKHNLRVIEDCAQAHGAECRGKRIGARGDFGTFSFYPGKNLGAYGDGGALVANDDELAKKARMIANHGRISKYNHEFEGRNSRLDGLQAAILSVKLKHLEDWTNRRIAVADSYLEGLANVEGLELPVRQDWARQVYHLFVIRTSRRDELKAFLAEKGVQSGIHYPIALPKLLAYEHLGEPDMNMAANQFDEQLLSLPIGEHMTDDDINAVIEAVKAFFVN